MNWFEFLNLRPIAMTLQRRNNETSRSTPIRTITLIIATIILLVITLSSYDGFVSANSNSANSNFDPYRILGLARSASIQEIKKAYKKQAKLWHPDKTSDPAAQQRFTQISEAYDILSTPEKKKDFDLHGTVRTKAQRDQEEARKSYYAQQRAYQTHTSGSYHYGFGPDPAFVRRQEAYLRETDDVGSASVRLSSLNWDHMISNVITNKQQMPEGWLIYVFSGTCEPCNALNPTFAYVARSLTEQFNGLLKTGKINSEFEQQLVRKLGIRTVPTIIGMRITPSGELTRHLMPLSRDSRGVTQPPTVSQLREFIGATVFPTQKDGIAPAGSVWSVANAAANQAPLFDITAGLGAFKSSHDASAKLKQRLQAFQTEHGIYPTKNEPTPPFVHIYVISQLAHPSLLLRYLAHRYVDRIRFCHISLPLVSHSQTLLKTLGDAFPGVDVPQSVLEGSFVIVQRESSLGSFEIMRDHFMTWEEDQINIQTLTKALDPYSHLHVPEFTYTNFFDLCYPHYSRMSSAERSHSPSAHRECLILFTDTMSDAQRHLLELFKIKAEGESTTTNTDGVSETTHASDDSKSSPSVGSIPRHLQIGWMKRSTQTRFYNFIKTAHARSLVNKANVQQQQAATNTIDVIILRASTSAFTIFPDKLSSTSSSANDILQWIQRVNSNNGRSTHGGTTSTHKNGPVIWIEGRTVAGGLPYPIDDRPGSPVLRAFVDMVLAPFRWIRELTTSATGSTSSSDSSSTIILLVLFTLVFLLTSSSMLRFAAN